MDYDCNFDVKYYNIYTECKEVFINEPESLNDLEIIMKRIYQEELLQVLGNVSKPEDTYVVIGRVWEIIKKQNRNDPKSILFSVCELHQKYGAYLMNVNDIDLNSEKVIATFTSMFSFHNFHILHKRICDALKYA
jgi:hypothetical protein